MTCEHVNIDKAVLLVVCLSNYRAFWSWISCTTESSRPTSKSHRQQRVLAAIEEIQQLEGDHQRAPDCALWPGSYRQVRAADVLLFCGAS